MNTLTPKKMLNITYSVDEIDIDVKRPNITSITTPPTNDKCSNAHITNTNGNNKKQHFLVEQVTIRKTRSKSGPRTVSNLVSSESSTEIKTIKKTTTITNFKNIPKIVVSNWDEASPLAPSSTSTPEYPTAEIKEPKSILKPQVSTLSATQIMTPVAPKLVEERTIDQFHDEISLATHDTPHKQQNMSCNSGSSMKGGYFIVEKTKPVNIEVELFNTHGNEHSYYDDASSNDFDDSKENGYYFRNCNLSVNDPNNNDSHYPNRNTILNEDSFGLDTLKSDETAFENDEYNFR